MLAVGAIDATAWQFAQTRHAQSMGETLPALIGKLHFCMSPHLAPPCYSLMDVIPNCVRWSNEFNSNVYPSVMGMDSTFQTFEFHGSCKEVPFKILNCATGWRGDLILSLIMAFEVSFSLRCWCAFASSIRNTCWNPSTKQSQTNRVCSVIAFSGATMHFVIFWDS